MNNSKLIVIIVLLVAGISYYNIAPNDPVIIAPEPDKLEKKIDEDTHHPLRRRRRRITTYDEALDFAKKEKKHILIWVNYSDGAIENQLPTCVHFHTTSFENTPNPKGLVIGRYKDGEFYRFDVSVEEISVSKIKSILGSN